MEIRMHVTVIPLLMKIRMQERDILFILICMTEILFASNEGEPKLVGIPNDIDAFTKEVWEGLNEENKVSLFVRFIDIATGTYETRIVNKNK